MTAENHEEQHSASPGTDDVNLAARIVELERRSKEQEPSLLRAIHTLWKDLRAHSSGQDVDPTPAITGLVLAYLRPRLILVAGSIVALLLGAIQIWLILTQNRLIAQQNELVEQQTQANISDALSEILARVEAGDTTTLPIRIAQLVEFGDPAIAPLVRLARLPGQVGSTARHALVEGAHGHSYTQATRATVSLLNALVASPYWEDRPPPFHPDSTTFVLADSMAWLRYTNALSLARAYVFRTIEFGAWSQRNLKFEADEGLPSAIGRAMFQALQELPRVTHMNGAARVTRVQRDAVSPRQLPVDIGTYADSIDAQPGSEVDELPRAIFSLDVIASPLCYGIASMNSRGPGEVKYSLWAKYVQFWPTRDPIVDECDWKESGRLFPR